MSTKSFDPFGCSPDALAAHRRMPAGRTVIHLIDTQEPDAERDESARMRAYRSWRRMAEAAKAAGLSTREYLRRRRAAQQGEG